MRDDAALLRQYAEESCEAAFTELVHRHINLVYATALRRTGGDTHRAADVAQQVFAQLARNARALARHTALSAWLHTATRNAALNVMISEHRRQARERAAIALEPAHDPEAAAAAWHELRPVLDAAIDELPAPDRVAVVLRFLEKKPFSAIASTLNVSEDAARMRTDRALEKMRAALARRGITSTAAALGAIAASQPLVSAPAGLAASVATHALAAAAGSAGIFGGALSLLMNAKVLTTATATAVAAFALGTYVGTRNATLEPLPPAPESPEHSKLIASLREQNVRLDAELAQARAAQAKLAAERDAAMKAAATASRPAAPAAPSLVQLGSAQDVSSRHKTTLNNLRQLAAVIEQFVLEHGRAPKSLEEVVGERKYLRRLNPAHGEDYTRLSLQPGQPLTVVTASGTTLTYDPTSRLTRVDPSPADQRALDLMKKVEPAANKALEAYRAANKGAVPPNELALLPYFTNPQDGADYLEVLGASVGHSRP